MISLTKNVSYFFAAGLIAACLILMVIYLLTPSPKKIYYPFPQTVWDDKYGYGVHPLKPNDSSSLYWNPGWTSTIGYAYSLLDSAIVDSIDSRSGLYPSPSPGPYKEGDREMARLQRSIDELNLKVDSLINLMNRR